MMVAVSPQPGYEIGLQAIPKEELLALARGLPNYAETRYEKYYLQNPCGEAVLAVLRNIASGDAVGMAALFPIELEAGGERLKGAIAGDLVIEVSHRTLGPALGLERHLLSALGEHGLEFVLAAPNSAAEPVFRRAGYIALGSQVRFAKILRSHRLLASRLPERIARPASWFADPLLLAASRFSLRARAPRARSGRYGIERPERFDGRFEEIWQKTAAAGAERGVVMAARSARLLNWKYGFDPAATSGDSGRFSIFALAREGSAVAYLVYDQRDGVLHVHEALWREAPELLFSELVRVAEPGASVIALSCFAPSGELVRALRRCGFVQRRSDTRLYLHVAPGAARARALLKGACWYFLQGDLDL